MKKVVLCNGYSLLEDHRIPRDQLEGILSEGTHGDWEHVMWGDPARGLMGRIPTALWAARRLEADMIIWSTGASRFKGGQWEAEVIHARAKSGFSDLHRDFSYYFGPKPLWQDEKKYRDWLTSKSQFDRVSKRTHETQPKVVNIIHTMWGADQTLLFSVSSANHAPRVMRDSFAAVEKYPNIIVSTIAAQTCYGRGSIADTKVDDLGKILIARTTGSKSFD